MRFSSALMVSAAVRERRLVRVTVVRDMGHRITAICDRRGSVSDPKF
ncbi:MAG TPA: hypothetical protein VMV12_05060 [Candidatus Micrarchaeaceae archaeon]|nr:hypothetical protein [Candidatus Micrarchaeaceae archaeon]